MATACSEIHNLDELRQYVVEILSDHCHLQVGAFPVTQRILRRGSQPCGVMFCLHGPRAVKFSAIWETDRNQVLFYNSRGERFHRVQLLGALALEIESRADGQ